MVYLPTWLVDFYGINVGKYSPIRRIWDRKNDSEPGQMTKRIPKTPEQYVLCFFWGGMMCKPYFLTCVPGVTKYYTPRSLTARPWRMMLGKRSFPLGIVYFQGRIVKLPGSTTHLGNGPWNKSLNFIFPTKYGIPKSLKPVSRLAK